jgi:protocatechuate 3,4-dioxygenase beta subunit
VLGRVIDSVTNRPLAGAVVTFGAGSSGPPAPGAPARSATPAQDRPAVPRVVTDAEGRFAFRNLPAGPATLTAARSGFADAAYGRYRANGPTQALVVADGERRTDLTLRLFRLGAIAGRVLDDLGDAAVGVQVRAFRRTFVAGGPLFAPAGAASVDDRGLYRISGLAPGDYVVCALFSTASAAVGFTSAPDFLATVMTPGSTGYSVSATGTRVAGTDAFVLQSAMGQPSNNLDTDGRPVGYSNACHSSAASVSSGTVVSLAAGAERTGVDLPLRMTPLVFISGTLTSPEGQAANYVLHLVAADNAELSLDPDVATAITATDGSFMFLGVPSGQYVIQTVRTPRSAAPGARGGGPPVPAGAVPQSQNAQTLWTVTPISVGRTDIRDLSIVLQRGNTISGRVEFEGSAPAPSAAALASIVVALEPAGGKGRSTAQPARVQPDGSFMSPGMPAGHYLVRPSGAPPGWMLKTVMAGVEAADVPLDLSRNDVTGVSIVFTDRMTQLLGSVRDAAGDTGTAVVIFPTNAESWKQYGANPRRLRLVRTLANGDFSFLGLPAGDYYLAAIDDAIAGEWQDPRLLAVIARQATRVNLTAGAVVSQQLDRLSIRPPSAPVALREAGRQIAIAAATEWENSDRPRGPAAVGPDEQQTRDVPSAPVRGTTSVSGRVVLDELNGGPVRRARVMLRASNSMHDYSTLTDEDGLWRLNALPAGRFTLTVSKAGYVTAYFGSTRAGRGPGSPVAVAEGAQVTGLVVRMARGAVITGTVTDESGQPVAGAPLRVWQLQTSGEDRRIVGMAGSPLASNQFSTDDRGDYRVYGLAEGTYYVSAAVTQAATPDIRLQSAADFRAIDNEARATGTTAAAGGATTFQPMPGRAVGFAPVFHPSAVMVDTAAGITLTPGLERAGVDIVMRFVPTTVVRGRLIAPDGQPPSQKRLMLTTYESGGISTGGFSQSVVPVEADGGFATNSLAPGRYTLWARGAPAGAVPPAGGAAATTSSLPLFADVTVEVTGDELPEVTLRLAEGSSVRGRIIFEGDVPPPDASTIRFALSALSPTRMASGGASASPSADGTFTLSHVPPGEYRASAFVGNLITSGRTNPWILKSARYQERDVVDTPFEVRSGADIEGLTVVMTNKMPEVSGTITDATGRPVPDLTIVLFSASRAEWRSGSRRILPGVQPDNAGRFVFAAVPAGEYYLAAVASADRTDLADPLFLEAIVPAAVRITVADGERKVQDLRIAGGK